MRLVDQHCLRALHFPGPDIFYLGKKICTGGLVKFAVT
jgi:hypothetical protein